MVDVPEEVPPRCVVQRHPATGSEKFTECNGVRKHYLDAVIIAVCSAYVLNVADMVDRSRGWCVRQMKRSFSSDYD